MLSSFVSSCAVALVVIENHERLAVVNVGDSRVDEISDGSVVPVSFDDKRGQEDESTDDPVITQALGGPRRTSLDPHAQWFAREPGLAFLLCSDGLHDLVNDAEMLTIVKGAVPEEACRKLILMAKERGGYDNITVAAVAIQPVTKEPASLKETRAVEVPQ